MRTIILSFVVGLFALPDMLQASTVIGGEITYRYIGDSTNINHQYEVSMVLYRTSRWSIAFPPTEVPLCVTSSCFPDISTIMPAHSGFAPPGQTLDDANCVVTNAQKMIYRTIVTLPGVCHDFRFRSSPDIARVSANNITNIQSWGSNGNWPHFLAYLNNTLGNNDSPRFTSDPQTTYCVSSPVNIIQNVLELEGDSLIFSIVDSRSVSATAGSCVQNSSLSNSIYASGFDANKPFITQGNVNVNFNQANGNISFFSGASNGSFMLAVAILEYRLDPADSSFQIIGRVSREVLITFDQCPTSQRGFSFLNESSSSTPQIGSYAQKPISTNNRVFFMGYRPSDSTASAASPTGYIYSMLDVPFDCSDTLIDLFLSKPIINTSVNSANIFIVGPDTQVIATQAVYFNQPGFSNVITLELAQPLHLNGQHFIVIANDPQDPMKNVCSVEFSDTLLFSLTASNCPDFVSAATYQLSAPDVRLSPNPTEGIINIQNASTTIVDFSIFDLRGVARHSGSVGVGLELSLDLSELPSGMYIISFIDANGRVKREKVIKR